jgi:hypothetical protein
MNDFMSGFVGREFTGALQCMEMLGQTFPKISAAIQEQEAEIGDSFGGISVDV